MMKLKLLIPILAILIGAGLVLNSVQAQTQETSSTSNNLSEQDTLDLPPGEGGTANGADPNANTAAGTQGEGQQAPSTAAEGAPSGASAQEEDVDLPPPTPPAQPIFPSYPERGTAPSREGTVGGDTNAQGQQNNMADQQPVEAGSEEELNWGESGDSFPETEEQQEDEFARRMMELNEEVLNREYYPIFIYEDRDRRDPFMPILQSRQSMDRRGGGPSGLLQYDISQLTLTAIAWNTREPKALIRDPKSNIYMVKKNDPIGRNNGYVEDIREGEVIIVESRAVKGGQKFYSTQILRVGR